MKTTRQSVVLVVVTLAILALQAGCVSKPSSSEIESAVKAELQARVRSIILGGQNIRVSSVKVKEWGSFQEDGKYWPAKISVVGSVELIDLFNPGKVKQFDKITEFRLAKDSYGKWRAVLVDTLF